MMGKRKMIVGIVFGSESNGQQACWTTVRQVVGAMDRTKYRAILIGVDKSGEWRLYDSNHFVNHPDTPKDRSAVTLLTPVDFSENIDVIFPVPLAPLDQDGRVEGLAKLSTLPFVGSNSGLSPMACVADPLRENHIQLADNTQGRVLRCAVLGNRNPVASVPGELAVTADIPAKLSYKLKCKIQQLAIKAFQSLSCKGLACVDFVLKTNNDIVVTAVNTVPEVSADSEFPRLWQASGICYSALINRLLLLALERFSLQKKPNLISAGLAG